MSLTNDLANAGSKIVDEAEDNASGQFINSLLPAIKAAAQGLMATETEALKALIEGKEIVIRVTMEDKVAK